jgi:hypothetical protein
LPATFEKLRCHRKPNGLAEALGSFRRGRHYDAVASLSDQGRPRAIELAAAPAHADVEDGLILLVIYRSGTAAGLSNIPFSFVFVRSIRKTAHGEAGPSPAASEPTSPAFQ